MLQLNPTSRLSLADVVGHAWMQGPMAGAAEVRKEFQQRQNSIKANNEAEANEKAKARKPVPKRETCRGDDEVDLLPPALFKNEDVYAQDTVIYSTYEAQRLFYYFKDKMIDNDFECDEKNHNKMKFKFKIYKE